MLDILEKIDNSSKTNTDKIDDVNLNFNFMESENKNSAKNFGNENTNDISNDINIKIQQKQNALNTNLSKMNLKEQVKVFVFCVQNESFRQKQKTYDLSICGKTMKNWLLNSIQDFSITEL